MTFGEAQREISALLSDFSDDALYETRLIFENITGLSWSGMLMHADRQLDGEQYRIIRNITAKRQDGYPLPYLLGEWGFYGHTFNVNPSVLIPRPETELLVDEASAWLRCHPEVSFGWDIGTGSGCIAISLLLAFPALHMAGVDISRDALKTACGNAQKHRCSDRFFPVQGNLFSSFAGGASLICANLPYIPSDTCGTIEPARYEPITALDGGDDGFDLYRLLFRDISNKMNPESLIICEIEYRQKDLALDTAKSCFRGRSIRVLEDYSGLPRLLRIE